MNSRAPGLGAAIGATLALAGVSTLGDVIWFEGDLPHRVAYGLAHGTLLCAAIGVALGTMSRRVLFGAVAGALIGFLAAGAYYLLAPLFGPAVMFMLWMVLWALFAWLSRVLLRPAEAAAATAVRASLAALLSGLAFYAISDIWRGGSEGNYLLHYVSWSGAFLPAFLVLVLPSGRT